jgi:hypothetical protein
LLHLVGVPYLLTYKGLQLYTIWTGTANLSFPHSSRMALGSIQLHIQWVLRLRISTVITLVFRIDSWHIQEQLYLCTEYNGGVASIVAFIHNIPGQNTEPTPPLLIKIL